MKLPEIMSRDVVNSGSSIKGYLNAEESMKTLAKSVGQSTLAGAAAFALMTILGDFEIWYEGPRKAEIATVIAAVLVPLRAFFIGKKYLNAGDDK